MLGRCLDTLLRLLHPVMPFVTDELWRALYGLRDDAGRHWRWRIGRPEPGGGIRQRVAEFSRLQELVAELRRFRTQQGIASRRKIAAVLLATDKADAGVRRSWWPQLAALADLTIEIADRSAPRAGRC